MASYRRHMRTRGFDRFDSSDHENEPDHDEHEFHVRPKVASVTRKTKATFLLVWSGAEVES